MSGVSASPLRPSFRLFYDTSTSPLAEYSDNIACSSTPVCSSFCSGGVCCPSGTTNCTQGGVYSLVVLTDVSGSGTAQCGQAVGGYTLSVEVFDQLNGGGTALLEDSINLGGAPISRTLTGGGTWQTGPAGDDVYWGDGFNLPDSLTIDGSSPVQENHSNRERRSTLWLD